MGRPDLLTHMTLAPLGVSYSFPEHMFANSYQCEFNLSSILFKFLYPKGCSCESIILNVPFDEVHGWSHSPHGVPRVIFMCLRPVDIFSLKGGISLSFPAYGSRTPNLSQDRFGSMDEAQALEEDKHTKALESLHNVPDPAANATTTWAVLLQ